MEELRDGRSARTSGISVGRLSVIRQDVVPIETGSIRLGFGTEPCKDKSAPCKSLQPICTFAALKRDTLETSLRGGQRVIGSA